MKILLAVDGSLGALDAVRYALQLTAQGLRAAFVLVNVQEPPTLYELAVAHDADKLTALRTEAGADLLSQAQTLLDGAGVAVESEVAGGEPVNMLLELAENYGCAAIILGRRGMGTPQGSGLGSVAQAVVQRAHMPVTVVHPRESDS